MNREYFSCFIILHYNQNTIKDTIECVESIKNNIYFKDKYKIIIVENGSKDNSVKLLRNKFFIRFRSLLLDFSQVNSATFLL